MTSLTRSRQFLVLWTAVLVSSSGTVLAILALSIAVYERTHLNLAASAVSATQWVMPLILAPALANLCVRLAPRNLLLLAEGTSVVVVFGIGMFVGPAPVLAGVLLLARSFLDAVSKAGVPIALKRSLAPSVVSSGVAHCEAARLYGAAIGALLGTMLLGRLPLREIMLLNAGALVVSTALVLFAGLPGRVQRVTAERGHAVLRRAIRTVRADPLLFRAFLLLAATTVPQALHNIGRTALSIEHLGLGASGMASLAIVTTVALGAGALLGSTTSRPELSASTGWSLLVLPAAFLVVAATVTNVGASYTSYGIFVVLFEISFVWFTAVLVHRAPLAAIEEIAALRSVVLPGILCVSLCAFGLLVDLIGLLGGSIAALVFAVGIGVWQHRLSSAGIREEEELADQPAK